MGIWIGIKKALNSTLGTTNFKPLDIIMEKIMHKYTLGTKQYVASDDLIIKYTDNIGVTANANQSIVIGSFMPAIGGYVRFNYVLSANDFNYSTIFTVRDETTGEYKIQREMQSDWSDNGKQQIVDIKISAGHTYKIKVSQGKAGVGTISNMYISGYIPEILLYDYTIGG